MLKIMGKNGLKSLKDYKDALVSWLEIDIMWNCVRWKKSTAALFNLLKKLEFINKLA